MSYDQLRDEAKAAVDRGDAALAVRLFCECKRQPASVVATPAGYLYRGEMLHPADDLATMMVAEAKAARAARVDPVTCTVSYLILDHAGGSQAGMVGDQISGWCQCKPSAKRGRTFSVTAKDLEAACIRHSDTRKAQKISV